MTRRRSLPSSVKAAAVRAFLNHYTPFRAAGARVRHISPDFREIIVDIALTWRNRNIVGTLFGGSMYTAVDPIYMTMFMQNLGPDYVVWDKGATIRFLKPGHRPVVAHHRITQEQVDRVRETLTRQPSLTETYLIQLVDTQGLVVAEIDKVLYFALQRPQKRQSLRSAFRWFFE